jgi:hypothetical protein
LQRVRAVLFEDVARIGGVNVTELGWPARGSFRVHENVFFPQQVKSSQVKSGWLMFMYRLDFEVYVPCWALYDERVAR